MRGLPRSRSPAPAARLPAAGHGAGADSHFQPRVTRCHPVSPAPCSTCCPTRRARTPAPHTGAVLQPLLTDTRRSPHLPMTAPQGPHRGDRRDRTAGTAPHRGDCAGLGWAACRTGSHRQLRVLALTCAHPCAFPRCPSQGGPARRARTAISDPHRPAAISNAIATHPLRAGTTPASALPKRHRQSRHGKSFKPGK